MKTKIDQTIKGLIILFIKLQFSIRCNQAFRPLHISNSKYLPQPQSQSQWSRHLHHTRYICIIPDIPHGSRHATAEVFASNQAKPGPTYSPLGLGAAGLSTKKPLSCLVKALTFMEEKQSCYPHKGEVLAASSRTFLYTTTKRCSRVIHLTS